MAYTPFYTDVHSTTDDTPLNADEQIVTGMYEVAIDVASGTDRKMLVYMVGIKVIAGVASLIDAVASVLSVSDAGLDAATAVIGVNSDDIRITLTGIAATNITWTIRIRKLL